MLLRDCNRWVLTKSIVQVTWPETETTCTPTLTHVKQVLLRALFGCCCHTLCHIFCLCLERREHLGVDLLGVHIRGHLSCFWCLTFALRQTADIKWSYRKTFTKAIRATVLNSLNSAKLNMSYWLKYGFSYLVVKIWAFFHLPSFLHSAAPGNTSDQPNLGPSGDIQTHSDQLGHIWGLIFLKKGLR